MSQDAFSASGGNRVPAESKRSVVKDAGLRIFYSVKPIMPRAVQVQLRRWRATHLRTKYQAIWPIDPSAAELPMADGAWPNQKKFALVLTHDLEDSRYYAERCWPVIAWEKEHGLKSAFNLVPEKSHGTERLRGAIKAAGFEVGVHGLLHDGKLYKSERIFHERAAHINRFLQDWGAVGFRSPAMHHNLNWLRQLEVRYDSSTFDSDPFQPQPDGVRSVFPFLVEGVPGKDGYVELPCTLPQDFTLFIELRERNIELWKRKLDWIAEMGGMALVNTHPDYMWFGDGKRRMEEYPAGYYRDLLEYVELQHKDAYWNALPCEVASYWRSLDHTAHASSASYSYRNRHLDFQDESR